MKRVRRRLDTPEKIDYKVCARTRAVWCVFVIDQVLFLLAQGFSCDHASRHESLEKYRIIFRIMRYLRA